MDSCKTTVHGRRALTETGSVTLGCILLAITMLVLGTPAAQAASCDPVSRICTCGKAGGYDDLNVSESNADLRVVGYCRVLQKDVKDSTFKFKNVNILSGGALL